MPSCDYESFDLTVPFFLPHDKKPRGSLGWRLPDEERQKIYDSPEKYWLDIGILFYGSYWGIPFPMINPLILKLKLKQKGKGKNTNVLVYEKILKEEVEKALKEGDQKLNEHSLQKS